MIEILFIVIDLIEMLEYEFRVVVENVVGIGKLCELIGFILIKSLYGMYIKFYFEILIKWNNIYLKKFFFINMFILVFLDVLDVLVKF